MTGVHPSDHHDGAEPYDPIAHAAEIARFYESQGAIWDVGVEAARQAREQGRSAFGRLSVSEMAADTEIPGPAGPIRARVFIPDEVNGVYLHLHGGGWMLGGAHHLDDRNEQLARDCGLAVMSIDYRLAPEHPYPAAPDDCEAAALWLVERSEHEFGTNRLFIGGESAGAHLSAVTMIRLRDRHALLPFRAANLVYGAFDLRFTPTGRNWGSRPVVISTPIMEFFRDGFVGDSDLTDPDVSPLFADLAGLPPALFTVGTADPLLDDSLFMAARWRMAGGEAELHVVEDAFHAFDYFPTPLGDAARARMHGYLHAVGRS